jgi:hypothetical protein
MEPPDPAYLLRKLLYFPLRNVGYGVKYLHNLASARAKYGRAQRIWGPRYPGIERDADQLDLLTLCAKQWIACVRMALDAFRDLDRNRVFTLRYESLARDPQAIRGLCRHIGVMDPAPALKAYQAFVRSDSNHAGISHLDGVEQQRLEELLGSTLEAAGYLARPQVARMACQ